VTKNETYSKIHSVNGNANKVRYGLRSRDVCHSSPIRYSNCCLLVSPDYRPYPMRLFRDCILQGQRHLLPLRLAFFRAYASSISLPLCLQGSIPGSWLAITWAGFAPASLCSIARPQRTSTPYIREQEKEDGRYEQVSL